MIFFSALTVTLIQFYIGGDELRPSKPPVNREERNPVSETSVPSSSSTCNRVRAEKKTILYWNDFYGSRNFGFCCGRSPYVKHDCSCTNCFTSKDRSDNISSFDVIVFHGREIRKSDIPKTR